MWRWFRRMKLRPSTTPSVTARTGGDSIPHLPLILSLVLAALVFGAFLPAVDNDFVGYDDTDYVTTNFRVQRGLSWDNIGWAFTTSEAANWHPFTWLSHLLDVQLFGLNPAGHHLTSILIHAASALLLFQLLRTLTGTLGRSFIAAALFALHPLRVESVAWIAERKDVLSVLFGLMTTYAYVRGVGAQTPLRRRQYLALALLSFACGLMSKPMLVTLPFTLLLLDCWPLRRWDRANLKGLLREKIPFFILAGLSSVITFSVQREAGAVDAAMTASYRLSNALISVARYLAKLFWPDHLAFFYPHPPNYQWPGWQIGAAIVLLGAISAAAIKLRRGQPGLLFGWCWFLGTLVPVIGLVQVGQQAMADRYTYLPSLGIILATVWGIGALAQSRPAGRRATGVAAALAIGTCFVLTQQQTRVWRNTESLCRHAIAVTSDNYLAHDMLGAVLDKQDRPEEALREATEALRIKPNYADGHNNLAVMLQRQGKLAEAIRHYEAAFKLRTRYPEAHFNLGVALEATGRWDDAADQYSQAIALKPQYADAHYNLGVVLGRQGKIEVAAEEFLRAIQINPHHQEAHNNLGVALDRLGHPEQAIRHYAEAVRLQPDFARAHFNLGVALEKTGKPTEAEAEFEEALRLNPDYAEARTNLALLRATRK